MQAELVPKITIVVSLYEAALIKKLREFQFGMFTVHKDNNEPRRVVMGGSEMLNMRDGKDLAR